MTTSHDGIEVLHYFESCRLRAYPDPATGGYPYTIGWGETGPTVWKGLEITQEEADRRFAHRLATEFEPAVLKRLMLPATQRQFDAMVCLTYNIGEGNFSKSSVLRRFNAGDRAGASRAFLMWDMANKKRMLGLKRRRVAEQKLFDGWTGLEAIAYGSKVSEL